MSGTSSERYTKKKSRGSTNNAGRLAAFNGGASSKTVGADWGNAVPEHLAAVIVAATKSGLEVGFTVTRDGGAYGLKLYDFASGERVQLWFNGDADLELELAAVYEKLQS